MELKAAVFDIDGTLLPKGCTQVNPAVAQALAALRRRGVAVIIATGRPLFSAQPVLKGVRADYLVTANGAWVVDGTGRVLHADTLTSEEMYALVDFCEDDEIPLSFVFPDGHYSYVETQRMCRIVGQAANFRPYLRDGEDQVRHLEGMPYGATAFLEPEQAHRFTQKYGYLGLRFFPFAPGQCDVVRAQVDKAVATEQLLQTLGITWAQTAAFGDGANDVPLLEKAGLAVAMENGAQTLKDMAHQIAPPCQEDGVARVLAAWEAARP